MIHRLEISNFYSIREQQVIDLRVAANVPDEPGRFAPLWRGSKERAPKVVVLFGANASGKSNVLRALAFVSWFIQHSFLLKPDAWQPYLRFEDRQGPSQPTRLAIRFGASAQPAAPSESAAPQCCYEYELILGGAKDKPQHVIKEALTYWPPPALRAVRLFERKEDGSVAAGKAFALGAHRSAVQKILRPNASLISTLVQLNHPVTLLAQKMAATIFSNILLEMVEVTDDSAVRHYAANPRVLSALNRELARIDLGIRAMQIQTGPNGPVAQFEHEGLSLPLNVKFESHGTRTFVRMFPWIMAALERGGVAVIDEMDLSIHPTVLPEVVRWFYDPDRNPHHAQLWTACQNVSLLEELVKEEVLLCEKDSKGRTSVYGLQNVRGVRRDDNFYRKYLAGVYGAVPHLG